MYEPRIDPAVMSMFSPFTLLIDCIILNMGILFCVSFNVEIMLAHKAEKILNMLRTVIEKLLAQLDHEVLGAGRNN